MFVNVDRWNNCLVCSFFLSLTRSGERQDTVAALHGLTKPDAVLPACYVFYIFFKLLAAPLSYLTLKI